MILSHKLWGRPLGGQAALFRQMWKHQFFLYGVSPISTYGVIFALQKLSTFAFCPYDKTLGINDIKEGGILVDNPIVLGSADYEPMGMQNTVAVGACENL